MITPNSQKSCSIYTPRPALAVVFLLPAIFLALLLAPPARADFNASYIISDYDFSAAGSMSEQQIQSFLEQKGSYLANYYEERHTGIGPDDNIDPYGWRASHVIWATAQWYGMNPQVILATLQKEQSLVTNPNRNDYGLVYAMGYGCPDSTGCTGASYPGFARQVDMGTWQLSYNMYWANQRDSRVAPYLTGSVINIDGSNVYLGNGATASLYRYTPHFHGNQNFYNIFTRWFRFMNPAPDNTGPTVVGIDQNGDNKGELAVFYDYGWSNTGLFLFDPSGSGYSAPRRVWLSGDYNWELTRSKITPVDQNADGKSEIAAFYDDGWSNTSLWLFDPNGSSGYNEPRSVWESGAGGWEWSRAKIAGADQTGDGSTELVGLYDYGNSNTGLLIFDPSGTGYASPRLVWASGPGGWDWSRSKVTTTDQNHDGRAELAVFYDYGNSNSALWLFDPAAGYTPRLAWISGPHGWDWARSKVFAADQNGDGKTELTVFYNYGNANTGLWIFDPSGSGYVSRPAWISGPGGWDWWRSKVFTADQNADSRTDITVLYNYDNANTGLWLLDPSGSGYASRPVWFSGGWEWARSRAVDQAPGQ